MKRETIEAMLKEAGVAEDKMKTAVDGIMAENGKDIEAEQAKVTAETAKLTTANNTIKELQEAAKKFDGKDPDKLKADLEALQTKYNNDIAAEQKKAWEKALKLDKPENYERMSAAEKVAKEFYS